MEVFGGGLEGVRCKWGGGQEDRRGRTRCQGREEGEIRRYGDEESGRGG